VADQPSEIRVPVSSEGDVVLARQTGRSLAQRLGFTESDPMFIATAVSEIARNIIVHARRGDIVFSVVHANGKTGLAIVASDEGPGIPDIPLAMKDGYSTVKSLGLGLPGARRLMDEFEIATTVGKGTTITMKKWVRGGGARARIPV
jgi:serine/threonine-protein kinase RsbT